MTKRNEEMPILKLKGLKKQKNIIYLNILVDFYFSLIYNHN